MIKKTALGFLACLTVSLHALPQQLQKDHIIDLAQINESIIPDYDNLDWEQISYECQPFNGAIEFGPYFSYLKDMFKLNKAVETGTWRGETTICLSTIFDKVHTVELNTEVFNSTLENLSYYPNIEAHFGNSPDILRQILPLLKKDRVLFYLDAHWNEDWPLLEELALIGSTHRDNCVIVIDDFQVPGRPDIPYDAYDATRACSFPCIRSQLSKVFSKYSYYFVIPKSLNARAKFVAFPKKWATEYNEKLWQPK